MERKFEFSGRDKNHCKNPYKIPCDLMKTANVYANGLNFRYNKP